jgi:hypothetical protein
MMPQSLRQLLVRKVTKATLRLLDRRRPGKKMALVALHEMLQV